MQPDLAGWNVLLVEDDPFFAHSLAALLRACGAGVDLCASSRQAAELLALKRYRLAILDHVLRGGDRGFAVAQRLAAMGEGERTLRVAYTGMTPADLEREIPADLIPYQLVVQKTPDHHELIEALFHMQQSLPAEPSGFVHEPVSLLVVDDDPTGARLAQLLLPDVRVFYAANGYEAFAFLEQSHVPLHAMLVDLRMPQGGTNVIAVLRQLRPLVHLVAWSAIGPVAGELPEGVSFLVKPVDDTAATRAALRSVLGLHADPGPAWSTKPQPVAVAPVQTRPWAVAILAATRDQLIALQQYVRRAGGRAAVSALSDAVLHSHLEAGSVDLVLCSADCIEAGVMLRRRFAAHVVVAGDGNPLSPGEVLPTVALNDPGALTRYVVNLVVP